MTSLKLTIFGRPVPKKNNPVFIGGTHPRLLPSKAFRVYEKDALKQLLAWGNHRFEGPIWLTCQYWLPDRRWIPDLSGLMEATADILQKAEIIENDKYICSWDETRLMGFDKENPRAEITIEHFEGQSIWNEAKP